MENYAEFAHRPVNLVAAAVATLNRQQCGVLVVHFDPPSALQTAMVLDVKTYWLA